MGTDRFQKILGTEYFGFRLFWFGSGSYRTNRIFSSRASYNQKSIGFKANLSNTTSILDNNN
jgi:hypothetical protein